MSHSCLDIVRHFVCTPAINSVQFQYMHLPLIVHKRKVPALNVWSKKCLHDQDGRGSKFYYFKKYLSLYLLQLMKKYALLYTLAGNERKPYLF